MKTGDEIWVPSFYRRRRFPWMRSRPRVADLVVGIVCAALALGFVAHKITPQVLASLLSAVTEATAPTAPTSTQTDGNVSPDRVAYATSASPANN
jgi:hypothetical protein